MIVLGSGAAGMAAAVGAATSGAKVIVLEAADRFGGTTATSGGGAWIPANPWAAAEGVVDSSDDARRYLRSLLGEGDDGSQSDAFVEHAVRVARLVEERTPVRWLHLEMPDYVAEHDGGNHRGRAVEVAPVQVPADVAERLRADPYGLPPVTITEDEPGKMPDSAEIDRRVHDGVLTRGRGLLGALYLALREAGGELVTDARAGELIASGGGVVGVDVGREEFRGHVIVATGGFERNRQFTDAFLRGPMVAPAGPPSNRGDGIAMGMSVGAALANMSDAWWVAAAHVPGESIDGAPFYRMLFGDSAKPGGIVVDGSGRRFANEGACYYGFGRSLHELDTNRFAYPRLSSWLVMDAQRRRDHPVGPLGADDPDPDWLARSETLDGLGNDIGVPSATLVETVERFNADAANGHDDDFGRGSCGWDRYIGGRAPLRPLTEPPFYALRVLAGCSGTKGGLRIDAHGRVLRLDGDDVIPGLYAAGNASAYMVGSGYPGPGATIGPAMVFGWLAGETAAAAAA